MNVMNLPDELREKIFLMLPGGSVHNSKQVSKEWCKVVNEMWKKKGCVKGFTFTLSQNWRFPNHNDGRKRYTINNYTVRLPFKCFIETNSANCVALKTWNNVPISNSRAAVYNTATNTIWEIDHLNFLMRHRSEGTTFRMVITEKFVGFRVMMKGAQIRSLVRVFSMSSHECIWEGIVPNLAYMCVNPFNNPNLLVVFANKISVLNFADEKNVTVTSVLAWNQNFSFGSFTSPFIVQCLFDGETSRRWLNVWKYDEVNEDITLHAAVPNLDTFIKFDESEGFINNVEDVQFTSDLFFMTSKLSLKEPDEEDYFFFCVAIHITDINGNILKEKLLFDYDLDTYIDYIFTNNKFIFEIMNDVYICSQTFEEILKLSSNGKKTDLKFQKIVHIHGRSNLMITELEARNLQTESHEDGTDLMIRSLHFWSNIF